jgi:hypothetical protein
MTCRRAFDVDLAAFLRDPRAPELADFVEHYPRCADCAAEVRAWTEVHLALAGRHPAPAELLAHRDGTLAAEMRPGVAQHVASCASCAEELRALERFDRTARAGVDRPVATAPAPHAGALGRVARALWHPAVAYAVALLLLIPVLAQRPWEAVPPADRQMAAEERALQQRAPERLARKTDAETAPPPSAPAAAPEPAPLQPDERAFRSADAPRTAGARPDAAARAPAALARAQPEPSFDPRTRRLTIPIADAARGAGTIEVRLRDAAGTRELRERLPVPGAGAPLVLTLPPGWEASGRWELELQAAGRVTRFAVDLSDAPRRTP